MLLLICDDIYKWLESLVFAILFCRLLSHSKSLSESLSLLSADRISKPGPPFNKTLGKLTSSLHLKIESCHKIR